MDWGGAIVIDFGNALSGSNFRGVKMNINNMNREKGISCKPYNKRHVDWLEMDSYFNDWWCE